VRDLIDDPECWGTLARMPEEIPVHSLEELPASCLSPVGLQTLGITGVQYGGLNRFAPAALNVDLVQMRDFTGKTSLMNRLYRVDSSAVCLRQDATQPLPCGDSSFEFVYSEHFIEHIAVGDARRWLTDVRRLLRPGGLVRLTTPDLRRYIEGYLDPDAGFFAEHRAMLEAMGAPAMPARRAWMVNQIFMFWGHRWIYDFEELAHLLVAAGFDADTIQQRAFGVGRDARVSAMDNPLRRDETLYVEAEVR
jgi:predicted SAM-dependent methyltransferase